MDTPQNQVYLTGKEGEDFDFELAKSWTKNHRDKHPGEPLSHFFGKEILQKILSQKDCQGIRFYHAHSKPLSAWQRSMVAISNFLTKVVGNIEGDRHLIIVGASSDGKDQLPIASAKTATGEPLLGAAFDEGAGGGTIGQQSIPCPGSPGCPQNELTGS